MLRFLFLLTVLSFGLMACDETDPMDTTPDSERIVGLWNASTASVTAGLITVPVSNLANVEDEQSFTFEEDGRFSFVFDPEEGRNVSITLAGQSLSFPVNEARIVGTYTLDETTQRITFSTIAGQTQDDFRLGYDFNGTSLDLTAENSSTIVLLFGLANETAGQIAGLIDGAEITYQKAGA